MKSFLKENNSDLYDYPNGKSKAWFCNHFMVAKKKEKVAFNEDRMRQHRSFGGFC